MDYDALLDQVRTLLQQEQRLAYRVLTLRLQLETTRWQPSKTISSTPAGGRG
jgi:hypothetical protein